MSARILVVVLLMLAGTAEATEYFAGPSGSGSTCSSGSPCTIQTGLGKLVAGDILTLQSGTYQGASQMLDLSSFAPSVSGTAGNVITVRALTDGGVFIDGQRSHLAFYLSSNNYWTFQGIDIGNNSITSTLYRSNHNTLQRMIFSNTNPCGATLPVLQAQCNEHTLLVWDSADNLLEDVAAFGLGRNSFNEYGDTVLNARNTYRRFWLRWEGWTYDPNGGGPGILDCGGPPMQVGYGTAQTSLYENVIIVYDPEQMGVGHGCYHNTAQPVEYGAFLNRDWPPNASTHGNTHRGYIMYGYDNPNFRVSSGWFMQATGGSAPGDRLGIDVQDLYADTRSQPDSGFGPFNMACLDSLCNKMFLNRVTSIRGTNASNFFDSGHWALFTNQNECTTLGGCPNIYTGDTPGTGSRACFRYVDGTLTSTPLWPWPMDDRIKAALARANAAGLGGSALAGGAGTGYAASTVTSEIVSRYGSIPTACFSGATFSPSFPVASDFPSIAVLDTFDRADSGSLGANWTTLSGGAFTIVSNQAVAPSDFARVQYTGAQFTGTFHEVYATWTTAHPCCGFTTILTFAGTDISENNQYRLYFNRQSGGNTLIEIRKVDSVGGQTTLSSTIDLGTDFANNDGLGVRVDTSTHTITAYWKWHGDGQWYRIGSATDSTLPTGNVYAGMTGFIPAVINDFGAGPVPTIPPTCPPICPPNPSTDPVTGSGIGRFGTTFPGVR